MSTHPIDKEGVAPAEQCITQANLLEYALQVANTVEEFRDGSIPRCRLAFEWTPIDEPEVGITISFTAAQEPSADPAERKAAQAFSAWLFIEDREIDSLPEEAVNNLRQTKPDIDIQNLRKITYDYDLSIDFAEGEINWCESRGYFCATDDPNVSVTVEVPLEEQIEGEIIGGEAEKVTADAAAVQELEMMLGGLGQKVEDERKRRHCELALAIVQAAYLRKPINEESLAFTRPDACR